MSVRIMSLVWKITFPTQSQKLIALKLADHSNDEGDNVYPGKPRVARECGCSETTVQLTLKVFRLCGLLEVIEKGGMGPRSTTKYRLNVDLINEIAEEKIVLSGTADELIIADVKGSESDGMGFRWDRPTERKRSESDIKGVGITDPKPSNNRQEPSAREGALGEDSNFDLEGKGVRARLRHHFSEHVFASWFAGVAFSHQAATAIAETTSKIVRDWLQKQYEPDLLAACKAEWPDVTTIKIVSNDNAAGAGRRIAP